jgi:hypothetical protein
MALGFVTSIINGFKTGNVGEIFQGFGSLAAHGLGGPAAGAAFDTVTGAIKDGVNGNQSPGKAATSAFGAASGFLGRSDLMPFIAPLGRLIDSKGPAAVARDGAGRNNGLLTGSVSHSAPEWLSFLAPLEESSKNPSHSSPPTANSSGKVSGSPVTFAAPDSSAFLDFNGPLMDRVLGKGLNAALNALR